VSAARDSACPAVPLPAWPSCCRSWSRFRELRQPVEKLTLTAKEPSLGAYGEALPNSARRQKGTVSCSDYIRDDFFNRLFGFSDLCRALCEL
jgi:hypothetical protein